MNDNPTFQGAVLKEQGVKFAVVRVDPEVLVGADVEVIRETFADLFGGLPLILMARDRQGRATFHGRRDIARFLSTVRSGAIDWIDFRLS